MYVWGKGCVVQNFFFRTSFFLCRESLLFQSSHQTAVCWKKPCDDKHYCTQWTPTVYSTLKYFHFRSNISTTSAFILVWKAQWYFWAVSHPVLLFLNSTFFQSWSLLSPERASSGLSKKQLPCSLVEEVCCCLVTKLCPTLLQPHGQLLETNFHVRVSAISWWAGALSACGGPAVSQLSRDYCRRKVVWYSSSKQCSDATQWGEMRTCKLRISVDTQGRDGRPVLMVAFRSSVLKALDGRWEGKD